MVLAFSTVYPPKRAPPSGSEYFDYTEVDTQSGPTHVFGTLVKGLFGRFCVIVGRRFLCFRAKGNDTTKHVLAIMGEKNGSITEHTSFVLIKRFDRCSVRSTFCLCVHSEASRIPPGRVVRLRFWGGAGKAIIIGI